VVRIDGSEDKDFTVDNIDSGDCHWDPESEREFSAAGLVGPWVAKGNPPVYLDSHDELELEEACQGEQKDKGFFVSPDQWRDLGTFLRHQVAILMGAKAPGDKMCLFHHILGDFDGEEKDMGKKDVAVQLTAIWDTADKVHDLEDEVE